MEKKCYEKEKKSNGKVVFLLLLLLMVLVVLPSVKSEAAWSTRPKQLDKSWTKCGSCYLKKRDNEILCKKGFTTEIIRTEVCIAFYDNGYVLYSCNFEDGLSGIYLYSIKEERVKCVVPPRECLSLFGFYKGYVYFSQGDYTNRSAWRIEIKRWGNGGVFADISSEKKINSLNRIGGAYQYKDYLVVLGSRGDPSPTVLKVFDLSRQKCSVIAKNCTNARVIKGYLYYSLISGYQKNSWGSYKNYKHTIYRSGISGNGKKKLAQFIGTYLPPLLETSSAYFFDDNNNRKNMYQYTYSRKKKSKTSISSQAYWRKYYSGKGYIISAG